MPSILLNINYVILFYSHDLTAQDYKSHFTNGNVSLSVERPDVCYVKATELPEPALLATMPP